MYSSDGSFLVVGTPLGAICIYNVETGVLEASYKHRRSYKPITCCLFTKNDSSILASDTDGVIWRYDVKIKEELL